MNKHLVAHYLCRITAAGSLLFLVPVIICVVYGEWEDAKIFLIVAAGTALLSAPAALKKPKDNDVFAREGLMVVALLWVLYPVAGAMPFYLSVKAR